MAAAAEFSGRPFVSISHTNTENLNAVAPASVLPGWKPTDISRLLDAAIFDEATFGRVKFHHRSIREYLAACWVNRKLTNGLPFHLIQYLFCAAPFGYPVLIPSRRAILSWLASLNVTAREWVTHNFPEMLLFGGDPETWDAIIADQAILAYLKNEKNEFNLDWFNDPSEYRRVARRLSPGFVSGLMEKYPSTSCKMTSLFLLVMHGRLTDCADVVFTIYTNPASSSREIDYALTTLSAVASNAHRTSIKNDLIAGKFTSNTLIASALSVIEWATLSVEQLTHLFMTAGPESDYGSGPIARIIKENLLPSADFNSAQLLLCALLKAEPEVIDRQRITHSTDGNQSERVWIFDVLPDSLERVLNLLPNAQENVPEVCFRAAERIEAIRNSTYTNKDDLNRLHACIANCTALRWELALRIARSEDIQYAQARMMWSKNCLVSFNASDIPVLIMRANDASFGGSVCAIWFEIAMSLAFRDLKGHERTRFLRSLEFGPDRASRIQRIADIKAQRIASINQLRQSNNANRTSKESATATHVRHKENLLAEIENIRDGTNIGAIRWLIEYSFRHGERKTFTNVNFDIIVGGFGLEIADALRAGLMIAWSRSETPDPSDYRNGQVPWTAIIGLAGLNTLPASGVSIATLSERDAARAAKLAVWGVDRPTTWFDELVLTHKRAVSEALQPWILNEVEMASDSIQQAD